MHFAENLGNIGKHKEENNSNNRLQPHHLKIINIKNILAYFLPVFFFVMHFNILEITLCVLFFT